MQKPCNGGQERIPEYSDKLNGILTVATEQATQKGDANSKTKDTRRHGATWRKTRIAPKAVQKVRNSSKRFNG